MEKDLSLESLSCLTPDQFTLRRYAPLLSPLQSHLQIVLKVAELL